MDNSDRMRSRLKSMGVASPTTRNSASRLTMPSTRCCRSTTGSSGCFAHSRAVRAVAASVMPLSGVTFTATSPAGRERFLREITARHGAMLVMDEVMTGFRVTSAGWYGLDPVDADLFTFGKVMGGGLPAAAFGGRADVMAYLAPAGPVSQAGTLAEFVYIALCFS